MLLNNFFNILTQDLGPGSINSRISFNEKHAIFSGHFPGSPIVPGVCMIQLVKEVLEVTQSRNFDLTSAENIKFLQVIKPAENNPIDLILSFQETESGFVLVDARLFQGVITFFKMKATLQPVG